MLAGRLERIEGDQLIGWLWDARVSGPLTFNMLVNGEIVGTFCADRFRGDLQRKGVGAGSHSFKVRIDADWLTLPVNVITIDVPDIGPLLGQSLSLEQSAVSAVRNSNDLSKNARLSSAIKYLASLMSADEAVLEAHLAHLNDMAPGHQPLKPNQREVRGLAPRAKAVSPQYKGIDQRDILSQLIKAGALTEKQVGPIVEAEFKAKRFSNAFEIGRAALDNFPPTYRVLNNFGRAALELNEFSAAIEALSTLKSIDPGRHGALFFLGRAYQRSNDFDKAYDIFLHCIKHNKKEAKYHLEAGRTAAIIRYGNYGVFPEKPEYHLTAIEHYNDALNLDAHDFRIPRELASLLSANGDMSRALQMATLATERAPHREEAWMELCRVHMRLGEFSPALSAGRRAVDVAPKSDGARFAVRIIERLIGASGSARILPAVIVRNLTVALPTNAYCRFIATDIPLGQELQCLEACTEEWISFDQIADKAFSEETLWSRLYDWAGFMSFEYGGNVYRIWRVSFLQSVLRSISTYRPLTIDDLLSLATSYGASISPPDETVRRQRPSAGRVLLISQFGIYKFGGAEQFLEQMARLYLELGYDVLMVGTRSEHVGQSGFHNGIRYTFVSDTSADLLALAFDEGATVVHVVSGLGFEIAATFQFTNIRLIFGVHFWRELFYSQTPSAGYYADVDQSKVVRPEFSLILQQFSSVYANSLFTREVVEQNFGVRLPLIYSLPYDEPSDDIWPYSSRDIVLLANARADKGFSILLEVASVLPKLTFVAIASQSDAGAAVAAIKSRGLDNVEVISRVDDMGALYRRALVVMVPSYHFIETFSRVVIEAQRFGCPVIGADRGNVPYLLTESGTSLPEDHLLWVNEINRITANAQSWSEASDKAITNSSRYSFSYQKDRLKGVLDAIDNPILIGVGSGLGNVIHTTPLIRHIARTLGRRVDVVVAGDYKDLLFVFDNDEYVNHVFLMSDVPASRRYETVFVSHSFGTILPRFSANRVLNSRDWQIFTADHELHESEFNLAAANALLGISYIPEDARNYFIGNIQYRPPQKILVGFHGGSKDGIWASKRWPYFPQLASALQADGIPVASFGTSTEFVPGTIDMTGGSIREMTVKMLQCTHFVSNDSGVMNLANALGIPLVALFGPTNTETRGPLGINSHSLSISKPCSPCEIHPQFRTGVFLDGNCRCIEEIDMGEVLATLRGLIAVPHLHTS